MKIHIFDVSCAPFNPDIIRDKPRGGSEVAIVQLADMFATMTSRAHEVQVTCKKPGFDPKKRELGLDDLVTYSLTVPTVGLGIGDTSWKPGPVILSPTPVDVLICYRSTPLPEWIAHDRLIVALTDAGPLSIADGAKDVVGVSRWQLSRCVYPGVRKHLIPPPVPPNLHLDYHPAPNTWCYVSAYEKGLPETLRMWHECKQAGILKPGDVLTVASAGWGTDPAPLCEKYADVNVKHIRNATPYDIREILRNSEALFYVNTYPETYSVVCAMADAIGLRTHVLCTKGHGGLWDTMRSGLTDHEDAFKAGVYHRAPNEGDRMWKTEKEVERLWWGLLTGWKAGMVNSERDQQS